MNNDTIAELTADVLIIGTEAAGAKAAIEAKTAGASVLVVTKGVMGHTGDTVMAGPAVQAPLGHGDPRDGPDVFFSDVILGGAFLNNQSLVDRLVNLASKEVVKMEEWGATFSKTKEGKFVQFQGPGSTYPRSLNAVGGGMQWRKALRAEFKRRGIVPLQDFFVTKLLVIDGQVAGAMGISLLDGRFMVLRGKTTIIAAGGCGQLFRHTDTSAAATGDGMALAFNAGAELMDMEFHQFFPYHTYGPPGCENISCGSLRYGLHGKLYNSHGEEFLEKYLPLSKGWGLRDPTSRAIYVENKAGRGSAAGGAYLSVAHLPANMVEHNLKTMNPRFLSRIKKAGVDLSRDAFEVGPAVHYTIGGIRVNEECETNLPRLFAAGESAAGMDGAERIDAGPAICWCLTMGYLAGTKAAAISRDLDWLPVNGEQIALEKERADSLYSRHHGVTGAAIKEKIKDLMWDKCGLIRDKNSLEDGLRVMKSIKEHDLPGLSVSGPSRCFNVGLVDALEAENMLTLAELTLTSALMRQESRRSHYRTDFPKADNQNWLKNTIIRKTNEGMTVDRVAPLMTKIKPENVEEG